MTITTSSNPTSTKCCGFASVVKQLLPTEAFSLTASPQHQGRWSIIVLSVNSPLFLGAALSSWDNTIASFFNVFKCMVKSNRNLLIRRRRETVIWKMHLFMPSWCLMMAWSVALFHFLGRNLRLLSLIHWCFISTHWKWLFKSLRYIRFIIDRYDVLVKISSILTSPSLFLA